MPESASDLYLASGISTDWVYGDQNVCSYTFELRPAGPLPLSGFALLAEEIIPTVEESFAAVIDLGVFTAALANGDFNYDQAYDLLDLDALTDGIVNGTSKAEYDVSGDALTDLADVIAWLGNAGQENLPGGISYLPGDANLDGIVDLIDRDIWRANRTAITSDWSRGDFSVDGVVNEIDFEIWLANTVEVPESATISLLVFAIASCAMRRNWR